MDFRRTNCAAVNKSQACGSARAFVLGRRQGCWYKSIGQGMGAELNKRPAPPTPMC